LKRIAGLALIAALMISVSPEAQASHSWGNYHWGRTSNPFSLKIVDSVVGNWDPLLRAVSTDWGASSVINTSVKAGNTSLAQRLNCAPISGKIRVCNASYGPNLWFGLATVWVSNGHVFQAVTQVNDYYFKGTYGNKTARRHVLCQEVGHDFGLDHHKQASCMDDTNSTLNNPSYLRPNSHDYQQLVTIYSHTDSVNTARASSSRQLRLPDRVRQVGRYTVLTYVFWVTE
jgi:hypothetical protein